MQHRIEKAAAFGLGSGELRFQTVAQRHQLVHLGDDAALLDERRKGNRDGPNFSHAQAEKSARCDRQFLHDLNSVRGIEVSQNEGGDVQTKGATSDDMVLVDAFRYLARPEGAPTNLTRASVSLDNQNIAVGQSILVE